MTGATGGGAGSGGGRAALAMLLSRAGWSVALTTAFALATLLAPAAGAQEVRVRDVGPGAAGRILRAALAQPHVLIQGDTGIVHLPRDSVFTSTVIIIGASATVASTVQGDVIVVGGDLWMRPGGMVTGRAIAIGGGAYRSTLAVVQGGRLSFLDETYVASLADGVIVLDYQELGGARPRRFGLGGVYGLGVPNYTRVDGLTLPFGVLFELEDPALQVAAGFAYRSHLGAIDPDLELDLAFTRRTRLRATAARRTVTNDAWIRRDLLNSAVTLAIGRDVRNYYRADRADVGLAHRWEGLTSEIEPFVSLVAERAWSVGPGPTTVSAPWSLLNRDDREEGMLRVNPPVLRGRILSGVAGARGAWEREDLRAEFSIFAEVPFDAPGDGGWQQITTDGEIGFVTFGTQRLDVAVHSVTTFGDVAPPQRFAYLGGSGTLPTFDLLEFGGDELVYAEGLYSIPINRIVIRYVGSPRIGLRYMIGAAGVGRLPSLEQNLGLRLALGLVRVDWTIEPVDGESEISFGVTFRR